MWFPGKLYHSQREEENLKGVQTRVTMGKEEVGEKKKNCRLNVNIRKDILVCSHTPGVQNAESRMQSLNLWGCRTQSP